MPCVTLRVAAVIAAVALTACDSSHRSPTAPYEPPAQQSPQASGTINGSMTIVDASPAGNCVADAFVSQAGLGSSVALTLPTAERTDGFYAFDLFHTSCAGVLHVSRESGYLDLDLPSYCDASYSDVPSLSRCATEGTFLPSRLRIPAPGADGTVRGDGTLRIDLGSLATPSLRDVELAVSFDLRP
jgi:hypothetical protein